MEQNNDEWRRQNNQCTSCYYLKEIGYLPRGGKTCLSTRCKLKGVTSIKTSGCDEFQLFTRMVCHETEPIEICEDMLQWCDPIRFKI
jgi:hypothetical protein